MGVNKMPFDQTTQEAGAISQLAGMPSEGVQGMGGPGVDTPQEQQAVQALMQGAQLFRQAAEVDPSIRYIIDDILQKGFLTITKHYGFEEEGKLALRQSQMQRNRALGTKMEGGPQPPGPPPAPPPGAGGPIGPGGGIPPTAPIEY